MGTTLRAWCAVCALSIAALVALTAGTDAEARKGQTIKKGFWDFNGRDDFATMRKLGAGVYSTRIRWNLVAPTRPASPRDPRDPAYRWNTQTTAAIRKARRYGMKVAVEVHYAPGWANGGQDRTYVPSDVRDYRDFIEAASRKYRGVKYWIIWSEPTRQASIMPLIEQETPSKRLDASRAAIVRTYARLLDAAYGAIKRVDRHDKVVGGNTFVGGAISPLNFIRALKLPDGRAPRMDLYGHHPFGARRPNLATKPYVKGIADFSDLDTLAGWVDRYIGRNRNGKRLKLWLGELCFPTDHANTDFNVWVTRSVAASWLRAALRITRRWNRIESLVWIGLYDPPPAPTGDETNCGLLDAQGRKKPAYDVFRRG